MKQKAKTYRPAEAKIHLATASEPILQRLSEDRQRVSVLVGRVLEQIQIHLAVPGVSVASLLTAAGLASGSIEATFHAETGDTILRYLLNARLEIAVNLLCDTDMAIADIAHLTAFSDRFHMNRALRRWLGMSPQEVRKSWQQAVARGWRLPALEYKARAIWLKLLKGNLSGTEAAEIWTFFQFLYPQGIQRDETETSTRTICDTFDADLALLLSDLLLSLPRTLQRTLIRDSVRCGSAALFNALSKRSVQLGRHDPTYGVEIARLALSALDANSTELGDRLPELRLIGFARLANSHRLAGDFAKARALFASVDEKASELGRQTPAVEAEILGLEATFRMYEGKFTEAAELLTRSIELCRKIDQTELLARCLIQRGRVVALADQPLSGIADLQEASNLLAHQGQPRLKIIANNNLAVLYALEKIFEKAERVCSIAKDLCVMIGDKSGYYHQQWVEGLIKENQGELGMADQLYDQARIGFMALGEMVNAGMVALDLAAVRFGQGHFSEASALAAEAVRALKRFNYLPAFIDTAHLIEKAIAANPLTKEVLEVVRRQVHEIWLGPLGVFTRQPNNGAG